MKLVKKCAVPASLCDAEVKLSLTGAFTTVEDLVTEMMGKLHIDGVTCMREYGGMWVFVRNRIEMPQQIKWMEEYTAKCAISSFSRVRLYIDTILEKTDGSVALASRLELCAVDLETGKIRKADTVGVGENTPPEGALAEVPYTKEKFVRGEHLDTVRVRSTDIDYASHTNNISYVGFIMDQYSAAHHVEHPVSSIEVQYVNQTHEGDLLELYRCESQTADAYTIEMDGKTVMNCLTAFR
jgi:acyl-ACP thioesterase